MAEIETRRAVGSQITRFAVTLVIPNEILASSVVLARILLTLVYIFGTGGSVKTGRTLALVREIFIHTCSSVLARFGVASSLADFTSLPDVAGFTHTLEPPVVIHR